MGGGAYDIAAPPMIIYADTQRCEPKLFEGNLQGCFLIITVVAILTHSLSGNVTGDVLQKSLIAIPFVLMGAFAGFHLDRFINPAVFRKIVLGLLLILGINLALTGRSLQQSRRTPGRNSYPSSRTRPTTRDFAPLRGTSHKRFASW